MNSPLRFASHVALLIILLLAAAFRFAALDTAPPGWRDDELIEFDMDQRIVQGWRPLFIAEAEGHEPFYHYLHAGTISLFGANSVGYKWLPFACGVLSVALTYALARRMFGGRVALWAAALLAVSFWPIMYARFGLRHIGIAPLMLGAFYLLYPSPQPPLAERERGRGEGWILLAGLLLAAALLTYFAGRALPLILLGFLVYLLVFNRAVLRRIWLGVVGASVIGALLALPMFIEIGNTPGAEKRTEVVGGPLLAALRGDFQPALDTTLGTLGMFTFAGDPESLYNIPNRPIFDWLTGSFFYLGVLLCFARLKRVESGFALAWLLVGIAPAFVSVPPASFSHTIAAMPVVYILAGLGLVEVTAWLMGRYTSPGETGKLVAGKQVESKPMYLLPVYLLPVYLSILLLNSFLTTRDYFGAWASDPFVRFQYHAPTRDIARWLDQNPQVTDVAIGTHPNLLWLDPLALDLDLVRADVRARWFNPEAALVFLPSGKRIFSPMQLPGPEVSELNDSTSNAESISRANGAATFEVYDAGDADERIQPRAAFAQTIGLIQSLADRNPARPGASILFHSTWQIVRPYPAARLKAFIHILDADGQLIAGDDRLDVNVSTLLPGDLFVQFSRVTLPPDLPPGEYAVEIGLYHSDTGERLRLPDQADRILLDPIEVTAP
ncbi:MAG TPA: glycosyltransferase family 39 protein [Anaerolineae bacterium]|nr:glycosyltransferase family 39 protein [Anaerolineae bacterium]